MTNVGPGSSSHSSLSSARRYLARIFVADSTSAMSIRRRMRASRRVSPISGMSPGEASRSGSSGTGTESLLGSSAASTRGRSASVTSTWRGLEPS